MVEDEEVVLKNNGLYTCLVEAGFHDFESIEKTELKCSTTESVGRLESHYMNEKYYSNIEEYSSYILSCLKSKLVFADDASLVEHYLASSKVPPSDSMIYQKFRRRKTISCLLFTLKELSLYVQKSIQFLLNCRVFTFISDQSRVNEEESTHLREVLFTILRSTILELKCAIVSLVKDYPLKEAVETHQYYLAYLPDKDLHCDHPNEIISAEYLQKMKYSYFLLQSEFLRCLCLCLVPNLLDNFSEISISQLFELLTATTNVCSQLCQSLKSHFEMHYLFDKRSHENRVREINSNWAHREAYVKLCSLSLNLQSVLRESRRLEQVLEGAALQDADYDRIITSLNVGTQRIDSEYKKCHSALDDFRKYVMLLRPKRDEEPQVTATKSSPSMPEVNKTNILVGKSDFRPLWPDEVFVGMSSASDDQSTEPNDVQSESVGNPCAKLLISELKVALRDKAEEWKKREKEALRNQDVGEETECEEELPVVEQRTDKSRRPPSKIVVAPVSQNLSHLTESSLAKQIAAASVSWQMSEEQHFSFGDDDSNDDTES